MTVSKILVSFFIPIWVSISRLVLLLKAVSFSWDLLPKSRWCCVIHAFITSKLDYCNSLYLGFPNSTVNHLQMVQNAAARLLIGTKKCQHITPVLSSLHWLPVKSQIDFKILLFVYKDLHVLAPQYISDLLVPYNASRPLCSSSQLLLSVPRSRYKTKGDRAFSVAAPRLWNSLPLYIRSVPSISTFKSSLKTYLYSLCSNWGCLYFYICLQGFDPVC